MPAAATASICAVAGHRVQAAGYDLSMGMLRSAAHRAVLNADIAALPLRDGDV